MATFIITSFLKSDKIGINQIIMEDTNILELYKTTKTIEGSQAQAQIVQDLFEGRGLKVDTAQTQLEGYYREFLVQHSGVAYQEIVNIVGLDHDKLSPVKKTEAVRLCPFC